MMNGYLGLLVAVAFWATGFAVPIKPRSLVNQRIGNETNSDAESMFTMLETENKDVLQLLTEVDVAVRGFRSIMKCDRCLWEKAPDGLVYVPYVISSLYTDLEKSLFAFAIEEFEIMTCVRFIAQTTETDYLSIESLSGCWSFIAKNGGKQTVSLAKQGCLSNGVIQHEIMHALGFYHEHTRSDREDYIDIVWQNIDKENQPNFAANRGNNLDLPYDYGSVMHYDQYTFTNTPGKATIIPKPDPKVPLGQKSGMSSLDVTKLNKAYNCGLCRQKLTDGSGTFSADSNNLVKGDNSCLWLIEVPYYKIYLEIKISVASGCYKIARAFDGGNKRETDLLANSCGGEAIPPLISSGNQMLLELVSLQPPVEGLSLSASYRTVVYGGSYTTDGDLFSPKFPYRYPNNVDADWSIIAPKRYRISLNFPVFGMEASTGCSRDYVTVTDGPTTGGTLLGTYCGTVSKTVTVESLTNVLILHFHSDAQVNFIGFKASWRFVAPS